MIINYLIDLNRLATITKDRCAAKLSKLVCSELEFWKVLWRAIGFL